MDIKYKVLAEWVERDLIKLERVDTTLNWADHFTKQLGPLLFQRHVDYIMGHVPPQYSSTFQRIHELLARPKRRRDTVDLSETLDSCPVAATAARLTTAWSQVTQYYQALL
jgi:hypothetical protein